MNPPHSTAQPTHWNPTSSASHDDHAPYWPDGTFHPYRPAAARQRRRYYDNRHGMDSGRGHHYTFDYKDPEYRPPLSKGEVAEGRQDMFGGNDHGHPRSKTPDNGQRDQLCSMFMHYTISEDRTGDDASVRSGLLATLGARSNAGFLFSRKNDRDDNELGNFGIDSQRSTNDDDEGADNTGSNLSITGIHPAISEKYISRVFEKYGDVESCSIMVDPHTKESRGFGFVKMMTSEQADAAKKGLQGEVLRGRTLSIEKDRRARPRTPTPGKYCGT